MKILGISAYYHDSAAALVIDGEIAAAAQEERFSRIKHDDRFPHRAIAACLHQAKSNIGEVDAIVFYEKPFLKFDRLLETYLAMAPRGFTSFRKSMPLWLKEKLFLKNQLLSEIRKIEPAFSEEKLLFSEHHLSHAASAFFASPFERAAVLTLDGVGEWTTTSISVGARESDSTTATLKRIQELQFPHSLGLLYSTFTTYAGFKVNSGEYKLMGLAPYGTPKFEKLIFDHLIELKDDGSFRLNLEYFDFCTGIKMFSPKFEALFGGRARLPESTITQHTADIAASIQFALEKVIARIVIHARAATQEKNLCLAGGVALNCVANGKILRSGVFDKIWIQPAAGDAGGALGAALSAHHLHFKKPTPRNKPATDWMRGSYLGPQYSDQEIEAELERAGAVWHKLMPEELIARAAKSLKSGYALGWHQNAMEFGPRALGNRSILADARSPETQTVLNLKIKFRESFRPFAPVVLFEKVHEWFDLKTESPYMLLVDAVHHSQLRPSQQTNAALFEKLKTQRSTIPAVTHVDNSARIQTAHKETNPLLHALLPEFEAQTGVPCLANTSFNVRGEPIVESPTDAFRCFMGTDLDALAIGSYWLEKSEQKPELHQKYHQSFSLD
ncbi:MAG: carbamoyltransferase [Bdellovibrionales bacterium]|nr:carbamoyltransferase [Bdellovibrionales bacterium]